MMDEGIQNENADTPAPRSLVANLRGSRYLFSSSCRRLLLSRPTIICAMLLALGCIAAVAWSTRTSRTPREFVEQIFLAIYLILLMPLYTLSYSTAGLASDREERTLVYLLIAPLPRPFVYLAKSFASLVLTLCWTMGGMALICWLGGEPGRTAMPLVARGVFLTTLAYVALFSLFGVMFRRATIVAVLYALFFEVVVGNLPGIVKRISIGFYSRCMIFDATSSLGVPPHGPYDANIFAGVPGPTAESILLLISGFLLLAGLIVFSVREYSQ